MNASQPNSEEWRSLYDAAIRVKELAPWRWMWEAEVFGVQNPKTEELGFVSVMGRLGEHFAIALYLGAEGLYGLCEMHETDMSEYPGRPYETPQLQASYEDRNELEQKDRDVIKELGYRFRGKAAWPMFRSIRPGFIPWRIESWEARFLTHALEQLMDVAPRVREDEALLKNTAPETYLVRVCNQKKGALVWEDHYMRIPPPMLQLTASSDPVLDKVRELPRVSNIIEIDLFALLTPIQEGKDQRPYLPYCLMMVEGESGTIVATQMLPPLPSLAEMYSKVPLEIARQFHRLGVLPEEITVRPGKLAGSLLSLVSKLDFKVKQSRRLPALDLAKRALGQSLSC